MGSNSISSLGNVMLQAQGTGTVRETGKGDAKFDFSDVMGQMALHDGNNAASQNQAVDVFEPNQKQSSAMPVDQFDRYQSQKTDIKNQASRPDNVKPKEVREAADSFEADVKEVLEEKLGVTEEQIEAAMETLGITYADLTNPGQLANLVAELTGSQEAGELLCNSAFLQVLQEVGTLSEAMLKELGISAEKFVQLCGEMTSAAEPGLEQNPDEAQPTGALEPETAEMQPMPEEQPKEALTGEISADSTKKEPEVSPEDNSKKLSEEQPGEMTAQEPKDTARTETAEAADTAATKVPEVAQEEKPSQNGQRQEHSLFDGADKAGFMHSNNETVQAVIPAEDSAELPGQVNVSDIIKQIVEFTKVTVSGQVSTMEMQLNPEHLGKLYLELTAKEGAVSAKIIAQNEVVKEALETQMAVLKEEMNQAGVKVEAIEVTVESHAFEKNLEQNARQEEQQAEQQEKAAGQTRRINLNDLEELSGIMTEEEALVAQMMAEQGNSVDFTA